ncbi:zinc knuckle, partial [Ostertagia ostertagi]
SNQGTRFGRGHWGNDQATVAGVDSRKDESPHRTEELENESWPRGSLVGIRQILLDNLSDWPEHFQLVGALHRVDPRKAYEEVKQLALSIEQSKVMFGVGRRSSVDQWRRRATQYRNCQEISIAKEDTFSHKGEEYMTGKMDRAEEMYGRDNYHEDLNFGSESQRQMQHIPPRSPLADTEKRKCFKCLKYGHIARHCPQQSIRVNRVKEQEDAEKLTLSEIIKQARSLGMTVRREEGNLCDLVGGRVVKQVTLLGSKNPALIDTGSMVSVIPVEILAKAQNRGIDVDALKLTEKSQLAPVFDASDRRMRFLGAVHIETELEGGNRGFVPFHISSKSRRRNYSRY